MHFKHHDSNRLFAARLSNSAAFGPYAVACLLEQVAAGADLRETVALYAELDGDFIRGMGAGVSSKRSVPSTGGGDERPPRQSQSQEARFRRQLEAVHQLGPVVLGYLVEELAAGTCARQ